VFEASGGVPRRINLLCDRVLLSGFLSDKRVFSAQSVKDVAEEINSETMVPAALKRRKSDQEDGLAEIGPGSGTIRLPPADAGVAPGPRSEADPRRLEGHLEQVEQEMRDLKETLVRVERGNHATLSVFRRFLDWMRSQDASPGGRA
jgi:general secretion pathway protein A